MNTSLQSLLTKFYTFAFFDAFVLIYPLYTLLFSDKGLPAFQIASLLIVWSITAFVLEVPSGAIADKFSRKKVLMIAQLLRILAFAVWLMFPSYWGFLVGFVLWGADSALTSGTKEALLYDELSKLKNTSLYAKITGRMEALGLVGIILAGFAASALAHYGYGLILLCSMAAVAVSIVALSFLPRAKPIEPSEEAGYLTYLAQGIREAFVKPNILLIVLFLSVVAGFAASDEYFSLLFREKGFDNASVAFWEAIIGIFAITGSLVAHKFENKKLPLELILVVWGSFLVAAAVFGGVASPLLIGLFEFVFYVVNILFTARLQHVVSDKTRATTTSVGGFFSELGAMTTFAIMGGVAQSQSYSAGFGTLGILVIGAAVLLWFLARLLNRKYKVERLGL